MSTTQETFTFEREAVPSRKGGAGRRPNGETLAFLAAAQSATKEDAVKWTPNVKGVSTKAANLRKMAPSLTITVRNDTTIYGYNPAL